MTNSSYILKALPDISSELFAEIKRHAVTRTLPAKTELFHEGQYIKVVPIIVDGLVRVFTRHEDKELLLYYIQPHESCIMSFSATIQNEPSKVFAMTEEKTSLLLLPVDRVRHWTKQYPELNEIFFREYNHRYHELLSTVNHLLYDKMDKRLMDYLKEKTNITHQNPVQMSHRQIANELGTAREVVSRVIKKLEHEGKVKQHAHSVEILKW